MAVLAVTGLPAAEVMVFAASSLTDSLKQIGSDYEKSGDKIVFNFAASQHAGTPDSKPERQRTSSFPPDESKMDGLEKKCWTDRFLYPASQWNWAMPWWW